MSVRAREAVPSAYTPSHMNAGKPRPWRRRVRMVYASARAGPMRLRSEIVNQHEGAALRLTPHPRERSME